MKFTILDGAMGTMLQARGLKLGERPELLCLEQPELITEIHKEYIAVGADVVYTNTFGANAHKLGGCGYSVAEVVSAAVAAAKKATEGTHAKVGLDIGPIGELLAPAGTLSFASAYLLFQEQMVAGEAAGADFIAMETMTDLYEVKAAVLAAKENTSLPIYVTMTFEPNFRTFTGCSLSAMALTLEGLGVDGLGINCSLGPEEIYPMAKELSRWTSLPLIVKPNAGLPHPDTGEYDVTPESFAAALAPYIDLGFTRFGGCCGTTPAYIAKVKELLSNKTPVSRSFQRPSAFCTPTKTVVVDKVRVIGERINPTGKKRLRQALAEQDTDYILRQALEQADAGADLLDINVGTPEIDEKATMVQVIQALQSVCDLPLQIDSSDPEVVEAALRVYNGKAMVNSVNGEDEVMARLFPIIKKYGAAVVGLTLDNKGIPKTAEERFEIAKKIRDTAWTYGIPKEDVYIDTLAMTVSVDQSAASETLKALKLVKEGLGVHTLLGVSNISFGLPNRGLINHSFLTLAMMAGLDMPILNPNTTAMMDAVTAFHLLNNQDPAAANFISRFQDAPSPHAPPAIKGDLTLTDAILKGLSAEAAALTKAALTDTDAMALVDGVLIPALDVVGGRFESGNLFLPQLLQSAQAAQAAFEVIKSRLAAMDTPTVSKGKILLATVKGDIHDIGKNIVKVILENYGYQIVDLGRDVSPQAIVDTVKAQGITLVGLSALMTTTLRSMEETIALLEAECPQCKTMVGGAVLTPEHAEKIHATWYAKDAKQSADIAKAYFA